MRNRGFSFFLALSLALLSGSSILVCLMSTESMAAEEVDCHGEPLASSGSEAHTHSHNDEKDHEHCMVEFDAPAVISVSSANADLSPYQLPQVIALLPAPVSYSHKGAYLHAIHAPLFFDPPSVTIDILLN